jgi:hypothetical protein
MPHEGTHLEPTVERRGDKVIPTHRWMQTPKSTLPPEARTHLADATAAVAGETYGEADTLSTLKVDKSMSLPILNAIQAIAERCDGAHERDLKGFNAGDTSFGRALAFVPVENWDPATAWEAHRMLRKYRKQLDEVGHPYDSLPVPDRPATTDDDATVGKRGRQLVRDPYNTHQKELKKAERDAKKQQQRDLDNRTARKISYDDRTNEFVVRMDRKDHDAREALKAEVPGRRFDWDTSAWTVPASSADALMAYATAWNFQVSGGVSKRFEEAAAHAAQERQDPNYEKKQNGTVTLENGKLVIATPYDYDMVEAIKALPGRRWNGTNNIVDLSPEALAFAENYDLYVADGIADQITETAATQSRLTALSHAHTADLQIDGFKLDLYDYQKAGIAYALEAKRTFLADQMGLGKTAQAIGTVHAADAYPAVVVCPATLKRNWEREFGAAVDGKNVVIVDGRTPVDLSGADVVILNYDVLQHHLGALQALNPKAAVFDESHYVKNSKASRTVAALALTDEIPADGYVLALTGTPVTNKTAEFVTQLQLLGQLESIAPKPSNPVGSFLFRYCDPEPSGYGNTYTYNGASNSQELQAKLRARCYVRRQKEDVLNLPKKTRQTTLVELESGDLSNYREAEKDFSKFIADRLVTSLRNERKAANRAAADGDDEYGDYSIEDVIDALDGSNDKYRKMGFRNKDEFDTWTRAALKASAGETLAKAATLRRELGAAKIPAAIERIDTFRESTGRKLVVFAHHTEVVDRLAEHYGAPKISGSVKLDDRQKAVDAFQNDPAVTVIVCNDRAAAEGITLTAASDVLMVEQDWTPMDQAEARVDRIGQTQPVTVHYLLAAGTMDEQIHALVERKRGVVAAATDGTPLPSSDDADIDAIYNYLGV